MENETQIKAPFCQFCTSKGVRHKLECTRNAPVTTTTIVPGLQFVKIEEPFVTKTDFDGFKQLNDSFQNQVLSVLQDLTRQLANQAAQQTQPGQMSVRIVTPAPQAPQPPQEVPQVSVMHDDGTVPKDDEVALSPSQNAIFEKYFDPNDGFTSRLVMGDKIAHIIDVPEKLSNAGPAHWKMYKRDIRQAVLKQGDVVGGIETHCKLVAQNLNYHRNLVTK